MTAWRTFVEETAWPRLFALDLALLRVVRRLENSWFTRLMRILTRVGDAESWVLVGTVLAFSGPAGHRAATLLATGAGIALMSSQLLKRLFRRPRPTARLPGFAALTEDPDAFSFPSGHTAVAFAIAVACIGTPLAPIFLVLACGIGLSRVYLGAHFPLDVTTGALLGSLSGLVAHLLLGEGWDTARLVVAALSGSAA